MEREALLSVARTAAQKAIFLRRRAQFIVYSMIAGAFCSIGMAFAYSVGASFYFTPSLREFYKLGIGIAFSLSFTLIIFAGCELFTSNVFVMTTGILYRSVKIGEAVGVLTLCYISNLAGAAFMAWMFAMTGLLDGGTGELLVSSTAGKMEIPFTQALFRGIMCNILVCLGYWAMAKVKSEVAKLVIIIWVVAGFVTPGYEHSIANAGIFTMALSAPMSVPELIASRFLSNLIPVTLGNLAGGALFVAVPYWIASRE
ncbi:MAG: formate/nitrite transporter family protein [Synergistaceae bacterium]|nr:formate/nitrite transporter family protein [Synergistaceae bacterium]